MTQMTLDVPLHPLLLPPPHPPPLSQCWWAYFIIGPFCIFDHLSWPLHFRSDVHSHIMLGVVETRPISGRAHNRLLLVGLLSFLSSRWRSTRSLLLVDRIFMSPMPVTGGCSACKHTHCGSGQVRAKAVAINAAPVWQAVQEITNCVGTHPQPDLEIVHSGIGDRKSIIDFKGMWIEETLTRE